MTKFFASLLLAASLLPAHAATLQPEKSEVAFTFKQMGVPVDGKFRKFDAKVAFDPKKPEAASIGFTVDLASVSLGVAETEAEIAKPDWFDTKKFPQATFQSSAIKAAGPGRFEVSGKLAIKGVLRDVTVPVQVRIVLAAAVSALANVLIWTLPG